MSKLEDTLQVYKQMEDRMSLSAYKQRYFPKGTGRVKGKKVEIDGHKFYTHEGRVYVEFRDDPNIKIVEIAPAYTLQDDFVFNGNKVSRIRYTSDFLIDTVGADKQILVEVKSIQTKKIRDYSVRRRLALKHFVDNGLDYHFLEITFNGNRRTYELDEKMINVSQYLTLIGR